MAYATYNDVLTRWISEEDLPATEAQIATLLEDAEDTILREFPDLEDRVLDGALPEARVVKVEARMIIRHLRNPAGVRSAQMGAGPFQQTTTYGGEEPGALYLTEDDRRELRGASSNKGKAFTVDQTPSYYSGSYLDASWWGRL
ncbi:Gp19/Gp15/Gp42 family protein [Streptomyces sp. B1I3]|uniref:Gp19/Gp15/Gp42 family protein n=1 Tax=Streptomyces sp. B1I3 TaxID=3042264 RepID=UPI00277E0BE9|nr:Gp19/Gp15/Gp42 family protein [Streptomyces sp. B1I3]MDQ0793561.1 hypothetical protein [Streptomyces sp. B1I3]